MVNSPSDKFDIYDIVTDAGHIGVLPDPIPCISSIISVYNTIEIAVNYNDASLLNQVWKLEF